MLHRDPHGDGSFTSSARGRFLYQQRAGTVPLRAARGNRPFTSSAKRNRPRISGRSILNNGNAAHIAT